MSEMTIMMFTSIATSVFYSKENRLRVKGLIEVKGLIKACDHVCCGCLQLASMCVVCVTVFAL